MRAPAASCPNLRVDQFQHRSPLYSISSTGASESPADREPESTFRLKEIDPLRIKLNTVELWLNDGVKNVRRHLRPDAVDIKLAGRRNDLLGKPERVEGIVD